MRRLEARHPTISVVVDGDPPVPVERQAVGAIRQAQAGERDEGDREEHGEWDAPTPRFGPERRLVMAARCGTLEG